MRRLYIQNLTGLPHSQVIGFGGELDRNRLINTLLQKKIDVKNAAVIGEHSARTIPIYEGEQEYNAVMESVQKFLNKTGSLAGTVRNLATAPLLTRMIESIVKNKNEILCVSGYHQAYGLYMTWPFRIWEEGATDPMSLNITPRVQQHLDLLISKKRIEEKI